MAISVWRGEAGLSFGAGGGMGHVISHPRMQVSLCLILSRSLSLSVCLFLFVSLAIFAHLSVSVDPRMQDPLCLILSRSLSL